MSILTEPVRLFRDNDRAALEEALTDDTIRALLDVAEAAEHEPRCPFCAAARNVPGIEREPHLHDCPLATLTEEADHE